MSVNVVTSPNTTAVVTDVQIGNSATSLIGLYATPPVAQHAAITTVGNTATGTELATAINALIAAAKNIGITL